MDRTEASSNPLVSVIVPTYNYGHFVGETLASVLAQTYRNWECLVVDDGSTDDTRELVTSFAESDRRIKYLRQENRGQPAALNTGLRNFAGEYLQILDADDLIETEKLERQVKSLEQRPEVDIVYSRALFFTDSETGGRVYQADGWPTMHGASGQGGEIVPQLLRANIMVVNAPLIRKRAVEAVGFFDQELSPVQDWDYWLRCAFAGLRFRFEDEEGARALVRIHKTSMTQNRTRTYRGMLLTRKKVGGLTNDAEFLSLNRDMTAADEGYLGVEEARASHLLRGMRSLFRAAALERRTRWRAKWLLCAVAAPFVPKRRMRGMVETSLTEAVFGLRPKSGPQAGVGVGGNEEWGKREPTEWK